MLGRRIPIKGVAVPKSLSDLEALLASMVSRAAPRFVAIFDFAREAADDVIDAAGGTEPFIVQLNGLYDRFVAPVDIPWIPDFAEPIADAQAKQFIAWAVRYIHPRIHTEG